MIQDKNWDNQSCICLTPRAKKNFFLSILFLDLLFQIITNSNFKTTYIYSLTVLEVKSKISFTGSEPRPQKSSAPFRRSRGESGSRPFPVSRLHSLAKPPSSSIFLSYLAPYLILSQIILCLSYVRMLVNTHLGSTQTIQDNLSISRSLITSAKSFCHMR